MLLLYLRIYNKFVASPSKNEISDDPTLSRITFDFQPIRHVATQLPVYGGQLQISATAKPILSKASPPSQAIPDEPYQTQTVTYPCSPSIYSPKNQTCPQIPFCPIRKAQYETRTSTTDDLGAILASLILSPSPESSILISQPPLPTTDPDLKFISPTTKSYLGPILCCKNVTPDVSEFSSWMAARINLAIEKTGEGSFGEVFRVTSANGDTVILKLMPLNAVKGRGSKFFTSIDCAANEIRLLERMQPVPGFVDFRGACVLTGSLPGTLIDLWKKYKSSGRTIESRDPSKKTSYPTDQLWLLVEMSDAGHSLEHSQYAPPGETFVKG